MEEVTPSVGYSAVVVPFTTRHEVLDVRDDIFFHASVKDHAIEWTLTAGRAKGLPFCAPGGVYYSLSLREVLCKELCFREELRENVAVAVEGCEGNCFEGASGAEVHVFWVADAGDGYYSVFVV